MIQTVRNLRNRRLKRLGIVFLVPIAFFLLTELGLRAGIGMGIKFFRNPDLYADWTSDDDYWKLRQSWGTNVLVDSPLFDPFLGWTTPKSPKNPLGALTDLTAYTPDYAKPAVLFVGDSFVEGVGAISTRIPQKLAESLKTVPVYNFGMSGYGLDQIYLRWQQVNQPFQKPISVVGMVTVDVDRSIMGFRTGPKPYFGENEGGELVLRGVPIPKDTRTYLKEYPPEISSYAVALFERQVRLSHGGNPLEVMYLRAEKERINSKLVHRFAEEARQRAMPLYFVLFYNRDELNYEGWREKFLKASFEKEKIAYLDTKPLFIEAAKEPRRNLKSFYLADGHLSTLGNSLVAQALANRIHEIPCRFN